MDTEQKDALAKWAKSVDLTITQLIKTLNTVVDRIDELEKRLQAMQ